MFNRTVFLLGLVLVAFIDHHAMMVAADGIGLWACVGIRANATPIVPGVWYTDMNCTGLTPIGIMGPIRIHVVQANIATHSDLVVTPIVHWPQNYSSHASTVNLLGPLTKMMSSFGEAHRDVELLAAMNGGYFYRADEGHFFDDICFGKNIGEASQPPVAGHPNRGLGDGATIINGTLISSTCHADFGFNRPPTLVLDGIHSQILMQQSGEQPPSGTRNAITGGIHLVSLNHSTGQSYVNIPSDDENLNVWPSAANTAVGLMKTPCYDEATCKNVTVESIVLVTVDGYNGCDGILDATCGVDAHRLAWFMLTQVGVTEAMTMDMGGSTTMAVKGYGRKACKAEQLDVVTCNQHPEKCETGCGQRNIFNGLAVGVRRSASQEGK